MPSHPPPLPAPPRSPSLDLSSFDLVLRLCLREGTFSCSWGFRAPRESRCLQVSGLVACLGGENLAGLLGPAYSLHPPPIWIGGGLVGQGQEFGDGFGRRAGSPRSSRSPAELARPPSATSEHLRGRCQNHSAPNPLPQAPQASHAEKRPRKLILAVHSKTISEYEVDKGSSPHPFRACFMIRGETPGFHLLSGGGAGGLFIPRRSRFRVRPERLSACGARSPEGAPGTQPGGPRGAGTEWGRGLDGAGAG